MGRAFLILITEPFDIVVNVRQPCRTLVMLEVSVTIVKES